MTGWLAEHGLELALALVSGAWFLSRTLVNLGAWKRRIEGPAALTEERLQHELRELAHKARSLIVTDLQQMVAKLDARIDQAGQRASDAAGRVQGKLGELEIRIVRLETRQEDRP